VMLGAAALLLAVHLITSLRRAQARRGQRSAALAEGPLVAKGGG
jgi:hypothetical protein